MNQVILIGRVGKEPELRHTKNTDTPVATTSLATTEYYKGEKKTTWHNLIVWGKLAEILCEYVHKGSMIGVVGKIDVSEWEKEGKRNRKVEISVQTLEFLEKKTSGSDREIAPVNPQVPVVDNSDDLPF